MGKETADTSNYQWGRGGGGGDASPCDCMKIESV